MFIWILLFILSVVISYFLAYRSMKNYRERPQHFRTDSTLYLIQNPINLTESLLSQLLQSAKNNNSILSFERLFRGKRQALIVFGPSSLLADYKESLSLLELNDYTEKFTSKLEGVQVWEMIGKDLKSSASTHAQLPIANNLELLEDEQFWWQIATQPGSGDYIIRAVLLLQNDQKASSLHTHLLSQLSNLSLISYPRSHQKQQMVDFYKDRSLGPLEKSGIESKIEPNELLYLLKIFN